MRKVDINECHILLLNIAKEFDRICVKHNIPYYMLGGTMLGAIRHKGFIPWDDDMDFGVPRHYYDDLVGILEEELTYPYKCYSFKNSDCVKCPFIKIADTRTLINDLRNDLPLEKQIGLNIDVFPLDACDKDEPMLKQIYRWERLMQLAYVGLPYKCWWKTLIKKFVKFLCPVSQMFILRKISKMAENLSGKTCLANIFGRWKSKEIVPVEWYGLNQKYTFENIQLLGLKEYDKYLRQMYGDYMKLPSENQQVAHVDNIYVKE